MSATISKIREVAGKQDLAELQAADTARLSTMAAYQKAPGRLTKDNYEAARQFFEETVQRLTAKYFPEQATAPEGERFKNRKQALSWLRSQGYKVSQGKFYQDCDAGFPPVHQDGTVSRFHVLQYGQQIDVSTRSVTDYGRKDQLEVRRLELDIEKRELENRKEDDRWMLKEDAWAAMAAIFGTLRDSLRHHLHAGQGQLIYLAAGDAARGPEVFEGADEIVAKAFNEVCNAERIEGVFDAKGEE